MKKSFNLFLVSIIFALVLAPVLVLADNEQTAPEPTLYENEPLQQGQAKQNAKQAGGDNAPGKQQGQTRRIRMENAIMAMRQVGERNARFGEQIMTIAQHQEENQAIIETAMGKVTGRGVLRKFIFGPDYKNIKVTELTLRELSERIEELRSVLMGVQVPGDKEVLDEQVKTMEEAAAEIKKELVDAKVGFSLFGWLMKKFVD